MTSLILVDTSFWIELLGPTGKYWVSDENLLCFATCPPVVQEVFQGLKGDPHSGQFRVSFLALPCLTNPVPLSCFIEAADIYATGRRKGYTIRSSVDCLIAAIALQNGVPILHHDRDFSAIASFTGLREMTRLPR
ncbi:MAG: PIN domain-containing protein [Phycisphaerae bacterium]